MTRVLVSGGVGTYADASPVSTRTARPRCSFPGGDVSPHWCERHHVIARYDGGDTNIANLTLVCSYHHHQFGQCVVTDDGLPIWIPPRWIDRHQRPLLNARITIQSWDAQDPLDLAGQVVEESSDPP